MQDTNPNARLETFSDGVFAIAMTLLIIDIKIQSPENIRSTEEMWQALRHLAPNIFAFLLSFIVIFITWVNHHGALTLLNKTSPHFMYANGLMLLTVVIIPFPTAMLGEFILTDHAGPAVALYSAVFALQAIAWMGMSLAALNAKNPLGVNEAALEKGRLGLRQSYYAFALYSTCAVLGFWFPVPVAAFIAVTWMIWLVIGFNLKRY